QIQHAHLFLLGRSAFSQRPLLVELLPHHLDDDRRHSDVHHADGLTDPDFHRDRHNGLGGRQNLQELGLSLNGVDRKIDIGYKCPGFPQIAQNQPEQAVEEHLLYLRDLPLSTELHLAVTAEENLENRKNKRRIKFQNRITVIRFQTKRGNAGWRRQTFEELRIRQLLHADEVNDEV